jgi:hypothetical protein
MPFIIFVLLSSKEEKNQLGAGFICIQHLTDIYTSRDQRKVFPFWG